MVLRESHLLILLCLTAVMGTSARHRSISHAKQKHFNTGKPKNFSHDFDVTWSSHMVNTIENGLETHLSLNRSSGSGVAYNDMFLFGKVEVDIKLIPNNSAGTVVAFYMTSDQLNRDEVDFMFLGNESGKPYTVQTNIYANGLDNRKERMHLWFDPSAEFHTYSVLWNIYQLVFSVDNVTIRVHKNHADEGIPFPRRQPMGLYATIWNGENWATEEGKVKIDWSQAPFVAKLKNFKVDSCSWKGNRRFCKGDSITNWWNYRRHSSLDDSQRKSLTWARNNYLVYDYCTDKEIINNPNNSAVRMECSFPKY